MSFLSRILDRYFRPKDTSGPLIPVFIPTLVVILLKKESEKGSPLTQDEVLSIRDEGVCVMITLPEAGKMAEQRGYDDINPENVWEEWLAMRETLPENQAE